MIISGYSILGTTPVLPTLVVPVLIDHASNSQIGNAVLINSLYQLQLSVTATCVTDNPSADHFVLSRPYLALDVVDGTVVSVSVVASSPYGLPPWTYLAS